MSATECATYLEPQPVGDVALALDGRTRDAISAVIEIPRRGRMSLWSRVDDEDYDAFSPTAWWLSSRGYAQHPKKIGGKTRCLFLHRLVVGLEHGDKAEADHINRDKLDNRRANLRRATHIQNQQNSPHSSRFRGVVPTSANTWTAKLSGATVGTFATEEEAAVAAFLARRIQDSFAPEPPELFRLAEQLGQPVRLPIGHWHERQWTNERCIEMAHEWTRRYGAPPSAVDWNPSIIKNPVRRVEAQRRLDDDGCWPFYSTITYRFGRWNAFIEAAGFEALAPGKRRDPEAWLNKIRSRPVATHCRRGHEFTAENTYLMPKSGSRQCKACNRLACQRYQDRKKQLVPAA